MLRDMSSAIWLFECSFIFEEVRVKLAKGDCCVTSFPGNYEAILGSGMFLFNDGKSKMLPGGF